MHDYMLKTNFITAFSAELEVLSREDDWASFSLLPCFLSTILGVSSSCLVVLLSIRFCGAPAQEGPDEESATKAGGVCCRGDDVFFLEDWWGPGTWATSCGSPINEKVGVKFLRYMI
jgi:hypothetical protein